jgi:hypothetical protein
MTWQPDRLRHLDFDRLVHLFFDATSVPLCVAYGRQPGCDEPARGAAIPLPPAMLMPLTALRKLGWWCESPALIGLDPLRWRRGFAPVQATPRLLPDSDSRPVGA